MAKEWLPNSVMNRALGKRLYMKITEVIQAEIGDITEKDCIDHLFELVVTRTFDGYDREIQAIYGQLEESTGVKIEPARNQKFGGIMKKRETRGGIRPDGEAGMKGIRPSGIFGLPRRGEKP
ncbi:MAG: MjaI family restriction endonuclease [Planctomycetota bacterium]|jgi:hypothetical protein|nr:MjaI family restriction endonuclease [Planctomycetota bacterium]